MRWVLRRLQSRYYRGGRTANGAGQEPKLPQIVRTDSMPDEEPKSDARGIKRKWLSWKWGIRREWALLKAFWREPDKETVKSENQYKERIVRLTE